MSGTVYEKLQEHLDGLPMGFPKTSSGVEMAILKKIFDPDEAEMATHLTPLPETLDAFSKRTGIEQKRAEDLLERMARKGQIFRMRRGTETLYSAASFVPGIWEYQLRSLDRELAEMVEQYFEQALGKVLTTAKIPVFRVLPVEENLSMEMQVMPYHRVKEMASSQKTIAVAHCLC
ncbi:MAG: hypothetical protein ACUVXD_06935 [Thermodesulfobacteriota bacterium]